MNKFNQDMLCSFYNNIDMLQLVDFNSELEVEGKIDYDFDVLLSAISLYLL